ncbi:enolase-phosphatase E1-like [Camellia sinensis]|uniref:enolase-phosphatase E1-like n=1 Tax=Camellia sinensis TaxID=4442 RepID=UPI0010364829|nr:enolase-phosphatase E1-like [Camellia sinensis]
MQAFNIKKELANKTKEAVGLQKAINRAEAKMKTLMKQAEEKAGAAEAIAKVLEAEKKEAEEKTADAQAELIAALATKDAEIKAADEKAYAEEAADVKEDYKRQVRQLDVPEDSPLKDAGNLILLFPPTPSQSEDEAESEEEAEAEKKKKEAVGVKSLTVNKQVVDLSQDEEDEVSKGASAEKTSFEVPIAEKSLNKTLKEIDAELAADKAAEKSSQMSFEPQTQPANDAE